jgi:hypothetical protein
VEREWHAYVDVRKKEKGGMEVRKLVLTALIVALVPVFAGFAQQHGIWPDKIVFFEEVDQPKVISMMQTGDAHLYGNAFSSEFYQDLIDAGLNVTLSYGSFNELLLNPAVNADDEPFFNDGRFNATGIQKVREGITYLIDRQYVVDEILHGLGARDDPRPELPAVQPSDRNVPGDRAEVPTRRGQG